VESELHDIAYIAKKLNVKPSWIRLQILNRKIPFLKIGKHIRFRPEEIDQWLNEKKVQPNQN